ncbi:MAG: nucleoside monophosphate kinase [Candidatus Saccharibacteria bacterium]
MEKKLEAIRAWLGQGSINIFGMPFAGKDTQGQALADLLEGELLGGGKILRGSRIPARAKAIMEAGGLIPIEDYLQIVPPYLSKPEFDGKPLILSSVGRWDGEQEGVLQATKISGHPLKAVVLLTVPEGVARKRHTEAAFMGDREVRADDAAHLFDKRLDEFRAKTTPVIDFYRKHGLVIEIDGTPLAAEVTGAIIGQLERLATAA